MSRLNVLAVGGDEEETALSSSNPDQKRINMKTIGDMYLAAAFLAYSVRLENIDRTDLKRHKFVFVGKPKRIYLLIDGAVQVIEGPTLEEVETHFVDRSLLLPPTYPDAIKRIKAAIHSA